MKVPPHLWEATIEFYRDIIGLKIIDYAPTVPPSVCFEFGANQLWVDRVEHMSQAEIWLDLVVDDIEAASDYLKSAEVVRCDEIEPLPAALRDSGLPAHHQLFITLKTPAKNSKENIMRKIAAVTFVTLDGIMQAPGAPEEDDSGGFKSGGWLVPHFDEMVGQAVDASFSKQPELLLGRKTYENMAAYWPHHDEELPIINRTRKYVVSTMLNTVEWNNSTLIKGDVINEINRLKEVDGPELQVHGSSQLLQTLLKHDLIDKLYLKIFPVVVGSGKRLFGDGTNPTNFKLLDSKVSGTGVIIATYERSGEFQAGAL